MDTLAFRLTISDIAGLYGVTLRSSSVLRGPGFTAAGAERDG